jgi:hypothetical protein
MQTTGRGGSGNGSRINLQFVERAMSVIRDHKLLLAGAVIALGVWATWPGSWALNSSCEPRTTLSQLSATLYGRFFWEQQLQRAREQATAADKLTNDIANNFGSNRAEIEKLNRTLEEYNRTLEDIYAKYPNMAPSPGERAAQHYRDLADQIEANEFSAQQFALSQKMASDIHLCEKKIARMLQVSD